MKNYLLFIIVLVLISCKKDGQDTISNDKYFTDLKDTLLYVYWASGSKDYNLDIDKDDIPDVLVTNCSFYSHYESMDYIKITPLNNFKVYYVKQYISSWFTDFTKQDTTYRIDTVMIPRIYSINDTIVLSDSCTANPIMIYYSNNPEGPASGSSSGKSYGINLKTEYFIGFRNNKRIAWLRIKKNDNNLGGIRLRNCRYVENSNFMIIK